MILQSRWARWCLLTVLVCGSGSMLQAEGTQGWLNNSFKLELSPKWDLKITQELQGREVDYDHTFLKNWSLGAFRALPGSFYAGGSFKREDEDTSSGERIEYRYTIEGGWKRNLSKRLSFDVRARLEIREFQQSFAEDTRRGRFRIRLRVRDRIGPLRLKPFVSSELFIGATGEERLDRNRFALGTVFDLNNHWDLMLNYLRQDTDDAGVIHAVNTGVEVNF